MLEQECRPTAHSTSHVRFDITYAFDITRAFHITSAFTVTNAFTITPSAL